MRWRILRTRLLFKALAISRGGDFYSYAYAVSADGTKVVGYSSGASGDEAFLWTSNGGMVGLGDLPGGGFSSMATGISSDGTTVVGSSLGASGFEPFRWTSGGGMVGLGELPGGLFQSYGKAISGDGTTVVGQDGNSAGNYEATRWTSGGGMVGLGDLAGGAFNSEANAASADGTVVVGRGVSASGNEAFRWTSGGGMVGLGDLPGGYFESRATAVTTDGSVVAGVGRTALGYEVFFWDATNGMQNLREVLISWGCDLTGWTLTSVSAISADGKTFVGSGTNPSGVTEAWIATVEPSSWVAAIPQLDAVPLILDFMLKGYQETTAVSVKTSDVINLIANAMSQPLPPTGTRLALHTGGSNAGKAYLIDKAGVALAAFDPIDTAIFSVSSSPAVFAPPGATPGFYKKSAYFPVNFEININGDTAMQLGGSAIVKTSYTDSTGKGKASANLVVSGPGKLASAATFYIGKGKASQQKK